MDVEQHDIGVELLDERNGLGDARRLADDVDRFRELRANAREEELVIVDEYDATLHAVLRGSLSSTSVPLPGSLVIVACPPARASRPSIDSAMPCRSGGTAARSKPAPRSWTKTATSSSVDLRVDVDLFGAGELRRVRHRLAGGEHERILGRAVTRIRELDADAVHLLHVCGCGGERTDERRLVAERPVAVEPAAQLALLSPRKRGDAPRLLRVPLDQRERLQDGVVHARRDLRAFLAANPCRTLGVEVDREPPEPRARDEQQRARDGTGREHGRRRAAALEQQHGTGTASKRPPYESGASGLKLPPRRHAKASPPATSAIPSDRTIREAERAEQERACEQHEQRRHPDALDVEP